MMMLFLAGGLHMTLFVVDPPLPEALIRPGGCYGGALHVMAEAPEYYHASEKAARSRTHGVPNR